MILDYDEIYTPTKKQNEAHGSPARYLLYGGAMGGGKSAFLVNEAIQLCLDYPGNRGLIARWELESFKRTTLLKLEEFLHPGLVAQWHHGDKEITLINGSVIMYGGLKPSSESVGIQRLKSLELGFFCLDEATEIPKKYFDLLVTRLRLITPGGIVPHYRGLLASNPEPGWVHDSFIVNPGKNYAYVPALPNENPHLPPGYVEQVIEDLEGEPELIKRYIEGSWDVTLGGNYIFPYTLVLAAAQRKIPKGYPIVGALDVAREGKDKTVLGIRYGGHFEFLWEKDITLAPEIVSVVSSQLSMIQAALAKDGYMEDIPVHVDIPGMGGPIKDYLDIAGINAIDYIPGAKARNDARFPNRRAEDTMDLKLAMMRGEVDIPNDRELISQLTSIKYATDEKVFRVESKDKMKTRGLKSPDKADTLIMAFANVKERRRVHVA